MPGKRTFNSRLAKIHRSYSVEEVARLYRVHKRTVRNWIEAGLPVLTTKRPYLILGIDLREFHDKRRRERKRKCRPGELYCLRCREPQRPAAGMLDYLPMSLMSGNFRGICPKCDGLIHRRVSLAKIDDAKGDCSVAYPHGQQRLSDISNPSPSCHLEAASSDNGKAQ